MKNLIKSENDHHLNLPYNGQHHGLNTRLSQILLSRLLALDTRLQHILHDKYNVLDKLRVRVVHNNLARRVEELLDNDLDLVEEDGVEGGVHVVSDQLLHVLLDLWPEFFVGTHEQAQQVAW